MQAYIGVLLASPNPLDGQQRLLQSFILCVPSGPLRPLCFVVQGTPHRLAQLAGLGALKLERLRLVLVDVALDAKQRCATLVMVMKVC